MKGLLTLAVCSISLGLAVQAQRGAAPAGDLPPVDAAANEAVVRLLAEKFDCPRGAVQILRGQTSRHKVIKLHGLAAAEVMAKLSVAK